MRTVFKIGIAAVVVVVLFGGCYLRMGGWIMIDPKYDQSNLVGLTSAQVVQLLGPPSYDPRVPPRPTTQPYWTSEAADGPLVLGYFQGAGTCRIEFMNDRVVSVQRYWK
jgi:hypothetical protein